MVFIIFSSVFRNIFGRFLDCGNFVFRFGFFFHLSPNFQDSFKFWFRRAAKLFIYLGTALYKKKVRWCWAGWWWSKCYYLKKMLGLFRTSKRKNFLKIPKFFYCCIIKKIIKITVCASAKKLKIWVTWVWGAKTCVNIAQ